MERRPRHELRVGDEVRLSLGATGRALMLDQCCAARDVGEGFDGSRGGDGAGGAGEVVEELDVGQKRRACEGIGTR